MFGKLKSLILSCVVLFSALLIAGFQTQRTNAETASTAVANPPASFKWAMPRRFGPRKPNGIVDYHWDIETRTYAADYVRPASWRVEFDACTPAAPANSTFSWEIDGVAIQNPNPTSCTFSHEFAAQRTYAVKLTIAAPDGTNTVMESPVTVKDLLIVSLGDSFASGQGNPDIPKHGSTAAKWVDKICARSAFAGPAQAALSIEQADPHTSVTFVSFACTGAEMPFGITGEQTIGRLKLAPQIDKLRDALNGRSIDALLISIGGNDIGFAELVARCLLQHDCFENEATLDRLRVGLDSLSARYQTLHERITALQPDVPVFITEYPDLVRDEDGELCHRKPIFDLFRGLNRDETRWASEEVVLRLNGQVAAAAQRHGWNFVSGIYDSFRNHGYCAEDDFRWVRTFTEARRTQGADRSCDLVSIVTSIKQCIISSGSVHPSGGGHALYASRLIKALQDKGVTTPPAL